MSQVVHVALLVAVLAACVPVDTGAGGSADSGVVGTTGGSVGSGGGGSAGPASHASIAFLSPEDGSSCTLDHDQTCPVQVAVDGAVLANAGRCGGSSGSCGHVDLYIDGAACGRPNTSAGTSSFSARLGKCGSPTGQHNFYCELRDDRGDLLATSATISVHVANEDDGNDDGD